jgi:hypothetical protein
MTNDICGSTDTSSGEPCKWNTDEKGDCPFHSREKVPNNGRPSKLSCGDEILEHLKNGYSLAEATDMVGIHRATVYNWISVAEEQPKSEYADFLEQLQTTEWWEKKYKHHQGDSRIEVECYTCGSEKLVYPNRYKKYDKHYCSKHGPSALGENSPNWKEDSRTYMGPHWEEQRIKALERDNYTCQSCGMCEKKHRRQYDQGLHVHHIIARSEFEDHDPEQNNLTNLVTLCRQCHSVYEGSNLSPVEGITV